MWALIGMGAAALGAAVALWRARTPGGGLYDEQSYGMTPRSHRRFALLSAGCFALFAAAALVPAVPPVLVLGVYVLALVLYASSFARGYSPD